MTGVSDPKMLIALMTEKTDKSGNLGNYFLTKSLYIFCCYQDSKTESDWQKNKLILKLTNSDAF